MTERKEINREKVQWWEDFFHLRKAYRHHSYKNSWGGMYTRT